MEEQQEKGDEDVHQDGDSSGVYIVTIRAAATSKILSHIRNPETLHSKTGSPKPPKSNTESNTLLRTKGQSQRQIPKSVNLTGQTQEPPKARTMPLQARVWGLGFRAPWDGAYPKP